MRFNDTPQLLILNKCSLLFWYIAQSERGGILVAASPVSSRNIVFTLTSNNLGQNSLRIIHLPPKWVPFHLSKTCVSGAPLSGAQTNAPIVCATPVPGILRACISCTALLACSPIPLPPPGSKAFVSNVSSPRY